MTVTTARSVYDLDLSAAFTPAWTALREHHHELPACAFAWPRNVPAGYHASTRVPGSIEMRFAYGTAGGRNYYDELTIEIDVSCLQEGAGVAFAALVHEGAHVLDWVRHGEISGHGERFAVLAAELGLATEPTTPGACPIELQHDVILSAGARREYAGVVRGLAESLAPWADLIAAWREWSDDDEHQDDEEWREP